MWSGKSLQLLWMDLTLWYSVRVCHQNDVDYNYVGSVHFGSYGGLSKSGLCVDFLVVGKCT